MTGNAGSHPEVLRLLEVCFGLLEEEGTQAVDDLLAQHPHHADAVRKRLRALSDSGLLEDQHSPELPERLGEFRLLERLGSGGMGVVYLAEQESLGRNVALKLVRPEHLLFPNARERFQREVEAVSRLQHQGIVAVHAVGEEQGVPYFAMEHVIGRSLDQIMAGLRGARPERLSGADLEAAVGSTSREVTPSGELFTGSWGNACLRLTAQLCEALDHAHERGVVHRDVKPSNVMITPDGRARLLDFGLAQAEHMHSLTRSGALLGSLPYMAPEQVGGEQRSVGPRTDVYAVGVTLYELLTLHAPYWSDTTELTRRRILEGRPTPITRLNSSVPWDAETVCLTAMDPDPARRYGSMIELLADVRRVLRREPIEARRPGTVLRARRWAQRHPAKTTGLVLGTLIVVGGPIGFAVQARSAEEEIRSAYGKESQQRTRAEQSLEDAIAAIDEILDQGSNSEFAAQPGNDPSRKRMLERALALYQRLLERERANPRIVWRVVHAYLRLGQIRRELGQRAEAESALREALALCQRMPDDAENHRQMLAPDIELGLAYVLRLNGQLEEAQALATRLIETLDVDHADPAIRIERRKQSAWASQLLGSLLNGAGQIDEALVSIRRAVNLWEAVCTEDPADHRALAALAGSIQNLAYYGGFHRREENFGAQFARAIELQEQAIEADPGDPDAKRQLAKIFGSWAHVSGVRNQLEQAIDNGRKSVDLLERLVADYPLRLSYAMDLLENRHVVGTLLIRNKLPMEAEDQLRNGIELGVALAEKHPQSAEVAFSTAILESTLGRELGRQERDDEAVEHWERASSYWDRVVSAERPNPRYLVQVGTFFDNWSRFEFRRGNLGTATELAEKANQHHRAMIARFPRADLHRRRLAKTSLFLASVQVKGDRLREAVATLTAAVEEGGASHQDVNKPIFQRALGTRPDYRALLDRLRRQHK